MNQPYDFKPGNIADYSGPLGHHDAVRIREIQDITGMSQRFTLERPFANGVTFEAYTEYVFPIYLRHHHLVTIGFNFNEQTKRYNSGDITLASLGYRSGTDPMNLCFVSIGIRIIPDGFPPNPTPQQASQLTQAMPYLHTLQNYCANKQITGINFDLIY